MTAKKSKSTLFREEFKRKFKRKPNVQEFSPPAPYQAMRGGLTAAPANCVCFNHRKRGPVVLFPNGRRYPAEVVGFTAETWASAQHE